MYAKNNRLIFVAQLSKRLGEMVVRTCTGTLPY